MPWFLLWSALILATLIGAFFLFRDVWRKARMMLDELGRASEVLEQLVDRTEELSKTIRTAQEAHEAQRHELTDGISARRRLDTVRKARRRRKEQREADHDGTYRRWRTVGTDPRFDRWRKP